MKNTIKKEMRRSGIAFRLKIVRLLEDLKRFHFL